MSNLKDKNYKGISIKVVAALNAVVAIFVLTIVIVLIGFHLFRNSVMESYEKGIPKVLREKIEEDKEVKFDPKCVEVLIEALPEVREVLKRLNLDYKPDQE